MRAACHPEDAVVVVHARPPQDDALAVEAEAVLGVDAHLADAEGDLPHVLAEGHAAGIEFRG